MNPTAPRAPHGPTPAAPPPGEPERSLRYSIAEGGFVAAATRIHTGPLCTQIALLLGARALHLGWLAALGSLATLGSAITAVYGHRLRSRRGYILLTAGIGRSLWLLPAVLLLTPASDRLQLGVFLAVGFLAQALAHMAYNGWQSWITDLVPAGRRGRFFGARNTVAQLAEMATAYAVGRWYDLGAAAGRSRSTLAWIYLAGVVAAAAGLGCFARQWEPNAHHPAAIPSAGWRVAWRDRAFRRLLFFCTGWAAAVGITVPFWVAHMIGYLHMSQAAIAVYPLLFGAASLVSQPLWGRIADRIGQRPVLILNLMPIVFLPLLWLPARPDALGWIWLDGALSGLLWPGLNLAMFNLLLGTAPRSGRSAGFALHSIAGGAAAFAAGLVGGWIAHRLEGREFAGFGLRLINHHILFSISVLLRALLFPLAFRLADPRAARTRALIALAADKLSVSFAAGARAVVGLRRRSGKNSARSDRV